MTLISRRLRKLISVLFAASLGISSTVFAQEPRGGAPETPKIILKSGGVLQGSATKRVEPAYPPLAKAARISGSVVVEVTVDEEGNVISARVISGHPLLKDAAVTAARGWTFTPTKLQGDPVKVIGTITFNFHSVSRDEIKAAKEKVNANPGSAEMHYRLAELYQHDAQLESAIGEYRQALGLEADYVEAYLGLGDTYAAAGRFVDAVDVYQQGLSVKSLPGFAEMLNIDLGKAYRQLDRNEEALDSLKRAVEINPDSVDGHFNLGLTFLRIGDKESAMKEYTILKDLSQDRAEMLRGAMQY